MCRVHISLVEHTIWEEIGDRTLFVFVVGAFLNRWSTTTVAQMTGSREDTVSKYLKVIKNAIHLEVEAMKKDFVLGGECGRVRMDESHVFTRKNDVGRVFEMTKQGWVFGVIENKPSGKLFLKMVKKRNRSTLEPIIVKHVANGATLFSDSWSAYQNLQHLGFKHYHVNHKDHFIEV